MQDSLLTDLLTEKLDELILNFVKTKEYEFAYAKLDICYNSVLECLQFSDYKRVIDVDDCVTEILIVFGEYLYIHGYKDGRNPKVIFKKLLGWIKKVFRRKQTTNGLSCNSKFINRLNLIISDGDLWPSEKQ
jgi:hypothetical protein